MYLHLGQDTVVKTEEILGIFDLDTSSVSKWTRNFLSRAEMQGNVINVTYELPKSFIVCTKQDKTVVYISQISSTTLLRRAGFIENLSEI